MYCQNMFEIAIELAAHDPSYDDWYSSLPSTSCGLAPP